MPSSTGAVRLNELKSRGVDTIVDLTVVGLGLYTYNDVPMYFHYLGPGAPLGGPEKMTGMFVRDIEHGIADTGVKAAILKCATDEPGVTPSPFAGSSSSASSPGRVSTCPAW